MKKLILAILALTIQCASAGDFDWRVIHEWSPVYEKKFSEFVNTVGESGCRSLHSCLTSAASNPFYANRTPKSRQFYADCADLPYSLRMYFAWMEGLPFDYVKSVAQADPNNEPNGDVRYSKYGNRPLAFREIRAEGGTYDAYRELSNLRDSVSTATYRMHYNEISDFYPVQLTRKNIVPGTVAYDPSGHAAIVYSVEKDGRIKMMDAHPDNSVTRITFDEKFTRSRPAHGAGLKNWRPELNRQPTAQLAGFSTEGFNRSFTLNGESVTFYDYLRAQMAGGSLQFNPVLEVKSMMTEICSNIHDREYAVNAALKAGIQNKSHPSRLPSNIYGTSGEWEDYSSPSRDARLKVAFVQLRTEAERFITMFRQKSKRVVYTPAASKYSHVCANNDVTCFLAASMMTAYAEVASDPACTFNYQASNGRTVRLAYTDVAERLFKLSFDPYHCAELRWGASDKELASCTPDANKLAWYSAEENLRHQIERTYDTRMDFDVNGTAKLGVQATPDVDLWGYLNKQLRPVMAAR